MFEVGQNKSRNFPTFEQWTRRMSMKEYSFISDKARQILQENDLWNEAFLHCLRVLYESRSDLVELIGDAVEMARGEKDRILARHVSQLIVKTLPEVYPPSAAQDDVNNESDLVDECKCKCACSSAQDYRADATPSGTANVMVLDKVEQKALAFIANSGIIQKKKPSSKSKRGRPRKYPYPDPVPIKKPIKNYAISKARSGADLLCAYCGKTFSNASHRRRHELYSCVENPDSIQERVSCNFCNCSYKREDDLFRHMQNTHIDEIRESAFFEQETPTELRNCPSSADSAPDPQHSF